MLFGHEQYPQKTQLFRHSIKYAGNAMNVMTHNFMNCAVYAGITAQQIDLTKSMLS